MLTPILDGENRFYIMALEDLKGGVYGMFSWYESAYHKIEDYNILTKSNFGAGRQNTLNMIKSWNNEKYGTKNPYDIWEHAKKKIQKGWFIPSIDEWCAFADQLDINNENHEKKGLRDDYFSSSQYNDFSYFSLSFYKYTCSHEPINAVNYVRLARTI